MTAIVQNVRFQDDSITFVDPTDNTKAFRIDCEGITTGFTRVMTVPDNNWVGGTASEIAADNIKIGDAAVTIATSSGNVSMTAIDETTVTVGNASEDAYFRVAASATAGSEDVRVVNTNGTDAKAIEILASAGGVNIIGTRVDISSGTTSTGTSIEGVKNFAVAKSTSSAITTTLSWSVAAASVVFFRAVVACYNTTDSNSFSYVIEGQAVRVGTASTAIVGASTITTRGTLGGHSITITADDANDQLDLNLISASVDVLSWTGSIQFFTNDATMARVA